MPRRARGTPSNARRRRSGRRCATTRGIASPRRRRRSTGGGGKTGIEPLYLPRYPEMIADARTLDGHADLWEDERETVDYWLQYDREAARLRGETR